MFELSTLNMQLLYITAVFLSIKFQLWPKGKKKINENEPILPHKQFNFVINARTENLQQGVEPARLERGRNMNIHRAAATQDWLQE